MVKAGATTKPKELSTTHKTHGGKSKPVPSSCPLIVTICTVACSHLQTDRRKETPTNEKKVSPGLKVRSPPKKALLSWRLFGLFDPTVCPLCGSPERTTESTISVPLTPRYPQLPLKNGMKLKRRVFNQPLKETVWSQESKDLHTENTLGASPKTPSAQGPPGAGVCLISYCLCRIQETFYCLGPGRDLFLGNHRLALWPFPLGLEVSLFILALILGQHLPALPPLPSLSLNGD